MMGRPYKLTVREASEIFAVEFKRDCQKSYRNGCLVCCNKYV